LSLTHVLAGAPPAPLLPVDDEDVVAEVVEDVVVVVAELVVAEVVLTLVVTLALDVGVMHGLLGVMSWYFMSTSHAKAWLQLSWQTIPTAEQSPPSTQASMFGSYCPPTQT
jgi:hypothetical protein